MAEGRSGETPCRVVPARALVRPKTSPFYLIFLFHLLKQRDYMGPIWYYMSQLGVYTQYRRVVMIRITRNTDYGIVTLVYMAANPNRLLHTANCLAEATGIPQPTISKLLKVLTRAEILVSQRGPSGGYRLSRRPAEMTLTDIIDALEGPVALTDCAEGSTSGCELEPSCSTRGIWRIVNDRVRAALSAVTLEDMVWGIPCGLGGPKQQMMDNRHLKDGEETGA